MIRKLLLALPLGLTVLQVQAVDLMALWDYKDPVISEARFQSALANATADEALILQTQIARTYVFRKQFQRARDILSQVTPQVAAASAEAQVRYWLELGRTYASHQHSPESQSPETKRHAHLAFKQALSIAQNNHLDGLAIDAIHMFVFVETAPDDQVKRGQQALSMIEASNQPEAKRWEASVRSNLGEALFELGRFEEALGHFKKTAQLREQSSNLKASRDAHWHIARVLRMQKHYDEALAIQLRLERESNEMGDPKHYVFDELALLYRARGKEDKAAHYQNLANRLTKH